MPNYSVTVRVHMTIRVDAANEEEAELSVVNNLDILEEIGSWDVMVGNIQTVQVVPTEFLADTVGL